MEGQCSCGFGPLFAALHVIRNDTGKYGATWVGITRLRHKSRHKIWRWRLAAIRPIVCGVADPPPFRTRAGRVQKNLEKLPRKMRGAEASLETPKLRGILFEGVVYTDGKMLRSPAWEEETAHTFW